MKNILATILASIAWTLVYGHQGTYRITDYGAVGDGSTLNTEFIQQAIDACAAAGGGTVYFPPGTFVSGTLFLRDHVHLHLEPGSVLSGSTDLEDYPVTLANIRSYTDNYTNKSLIYAEGLENISITGKGRIDGNGASFEITKMPNDDNIRQKNDWAYYKSRPFMIRMINCKGIVIRDITIVDSPMWVQHYLACEDVHIDGIGVYSRVNDNNDGIDIDGCDGVRISNCRISTGDDAIVLKSTLDRTCRNVTVTNCILSSRTNAFKLGTESNGGFENIVFTNSVVTQTGSCGVALEMVDGGTLRNVIVSNISMNTVGGALFIRLGNRARPFREDMDKPGMGSLSDVMISNIQAENVGKTGSSITGLPGYPVRNISLEMIRIEYVGGGTRDLAEKEVPEFPEKYPEYNMFGLLPAYGLYCRHVENLTLKNIEFRHAEPEARPAILFEDVTGLPMSSGPSFAAPFRATAPARPGIRSWTNGLVCTP